MGDTFHNSGNVVGAAIGRGASVTAERIIAKIRQGAEQSPDTDLVAAVEAAWDAIAKAKLAEVDQEEATEILSKIGGEVTKEPTAIDAERPKRLQRWLAHLAALCQPAADAIGAAKAVLATLRET